MYNVKPETALSKPEFHEATYIWWFNKGTNGIYRFGKFSIRLNRLT